MMRPARVAVIYYSATGNVHRLAHALAARTHVARILNKLNLHDRTQAAVLAYESGLVDPGPATTNERRSDVMAAQS